MLRLSLTRGPDGAPLLAEHALPRAALQGGFAYHGIVSRAMLSRAAELSPGARAAWDEVAAPLEDVLCGRLEREQLRGSGTPLAEHVRAWASLAQECGVRSLRGSAALACEAVRQAVAGRLDPDPGGWRPAAGRRPGGSGRVEVRWVKEGHTSSVWRVQVDGRTHTRFCVNVGRDHEADEELLATTTELERWGARDPELVCPLLWAGTLGGEGEGSGGDEAAVTITGWVDGLELHPGPVGGDGPRPLAAIDHFTAVADPATGSPRQRAVGRWLAPDDVRTAWSQLTEFLRRQAEDAPGGRIRAPCLALEEGDVVWTGEGIVAVAASPAEVIYPETWRERLDEIEGYAGGPARAETS